MFRRESVVRAYHLALGATTDRRLHRERLKQRTQPGAGFFEIPIPPLSAADGRKVRELTWPDGATLVSVRRSSSVLIPHGDTTLQSGDTITAFGTGESRVELAFVVEPAPEIEAIIVPDSDGVT
jgi:Trk K+ transport system NAD-binding subunit